MYLELIDIISIVTTVLLFSFFFFLLFLKDRRTSNILLALFIFSNAMYILGFLYWRLRIHLPDEAVLFSFIGNACGYLFGPLLFFYTKTLVVKNYKLNKKNIIHFLPFLAALIYNFFNADMYAIYSYILMQIQIFIYMALCLQMLKNYHLELKRYYSSIEKLHLHRLEIILFTFILMWLVDLVNFILALSSIVHHNIYMVLQNISLSINFIFANLIVFNTLQFTDISLEQQNNKFEKYEKSKLTSQKKEEYLTKLMAYLKSEKPYLIPSVTLNDFSQNLNIPPRDLSQVINEFLHRNFYDFINSYRVEKAKNLLSDSAEEKTILEILFEVGFNSKSAFNTAFKKHTGLTPTKFKIKFKSKEFA